MQLYREISNLFKVSSFFNDCLPFTKQVKYKVSSMAKNYRMHFCYRRTIRLKQENLSCNKIKRQITQDINLLLTKTTAARSSQQAVMTDTVRKCCCSLNKRKFSRFRRAKYKRLFSTGNDFLRTYEYFNFRWTLRLFYLCFCLFFTDR